MRVDLLDNCSSTECRIYVWILASAWPVGLLCGISLSYFSRFLSASLMHSAIYSSMSIVGLLFSHFIPLFLTAIAVIFSLHIWVVFLSFSRAVMTGFCVFCIAFAFGDSSWLICLLFLFSNCSVNAIILWLSFHIRTLKRQDLVGQIAVAFAICLFVSIIDCIYIHPILVRCMELY